MSEYSSCLLQGYGVLAGPPLRFKAPLIAQHFAIVEWSPPKILPETVLNYNIHLRRLDRGEEYEVFEKDHSPFIIENLESNAYYEAYVVAINAHGKGATSTRLVFQTKKTVRKDLCKMLSIGNNGRIFYFKIDDSDRISNPSYNMTSCCKTANIMPACMPLCSYDLKMSDLQLLGQTCSLQMGEYRVLSCSERESSKLILQ